MIVGLFVLLLSIRSAFSRVYTNESIQAKQEKYDRYVECIGSRNAASLRIDNKTVSQRFFKALIFPRDSSIKLKCFVCLAPDEEESIEEVWKPNDSFIGRSTRILKDRIKEALQKIQGIEKDESMKTSFDWEYISLDKRGSWKSVMDLREPIIPSAKAKRVVESFTMKSEATKAIGDHFELEIFRANHSKHAGFYRCMRKNKKLSKIEQLYFVDVLPKIKVKVRKFDEEVKEAEVIKMFEHGVEAIWETTPWGPCNKCGYEVGEQYRRIQCVLKVTPESLEPLLKSKFKFLIFLNSVPCSSSLVPSETRSELKNFIPIEEFRPCESICRLPKNESRIVYDTNEDGERVIKEELQSDEFAVNERLPLLKPSVSRRTLREIEGDTVILDCGFHDGDIYWRKDFKDLTSEEFLQDESGRRYINFEGQLVFLEIQMSDAGLYSCVSPPNDLRRTFHLYVSESNRTLEWIGWIQIVIRYFTGLFICIRITRIVLKTKMNIEHRTHDSTPDVNKNQ